MIIIMSLSFASCSVENIEIEIPTQSEYFLEEWPSFEFSGNSYSFQKDSEPYFSILKHDKVCAKLKMIGQSNFSLLNYPNGVVELSPILSDNEYTILDPVDLFEIGFFVREIFSLPNKRDIDSYSGEILIAKYPNIKFDNSEWVKTKYDMKTVKKILDSYYNSNPSNYKGNPNWITYECKLFLKGIKNVSIDFQISQENGKYYFLKGDKYYQIPNETVEYILTNLEDSTDDFYNSYYGIVNSGDRSVS